MYNLYYTYNGFTGTLLELCEIFDKDINDVQKILNHCKGFLFETEAITKAPLCKNSIIRNGDSYELPEFSLSDEQRKAAEEHYNIFENYVNNRKIKDEDLKSDLYMCYLYVISRIQISDFSYSKCSTNIANRIKYYYIQLCKRKNIFIQRKTRLSENIGVDFLYSSDTKIYYEQLKEIYQSIREYIFNECPLTEREYKVIKMRYGFGNYSPSTLEKIATELHVNRERIRQIEAKALRKLRHPSRKMYLLKSFVDETYYVSKITDDGFYINLSDGIPYYYIEESFRTQQEIQQKLKNPLNQHKVYIGSYECSLIEDVYYKNNHSHRLLTKNGRYRKCNIGEREVYCFYNGKD